MTVALSLPTLRLSDDESTTLTDLLTQLALYQPRNQVKADYYEAKTRMEDLRIAIPPSLSGLQCCVGWPSVAVDAIEERLDFEKWSTPTEDDYGLAEVYAANDLDVESGVAHLDSLIYGTSFVGVSTGLDGEADPLVTVESPKNMTATIDPRSRRTQKALKVIHDDEGQIVGGDLFLQGQTVALECRHGAWLVVNRDVHNLSRVPVAQIVNRPRSGDRCGRSEITRVVRSLTQSGMRTLAASEIAREYYAAPQRFILGARESAFVDSDGNPLPAWKSYIGRLLALERDENGELPEIKEFKGAGLESFFGMMRMLTQLMSSELAVPASYLGFTTENPPSADAIAAL